MYYVVGDSNNIHNIDSLLGGIRGDATLDHYVQEKYGRDCDWKLADQVDDDDDVVLTLPHFQVMDDSDNFQVGIAIVRRVDEGMSVCLCSSIFLFSIFFSFFLLFFSFICLICSFILLFF